MIDKEFNETIKRLIQTQQAFRERKEMATKIKAYHKSVKVQAAITTYDGAGIFLSNHKNAIN